MGQKFERREFLALMGIGGAAAATMSCSDPASFEEQWKPWLEPQEGMIPYQPNFYATSSRESGGAGLLVKTLGGRAVKIEGNPHHPINKGTLTARQQSVIQGLYGTERIRKPRLKTGEEVTWNQALNLLKERLEENRGKSISALTGLTTGAVYEIWSRFIAAMGGGRVVHFEPFTGSDMLHASERVFGVAALPFISFEGADLVLSLGARFLETWGDVTSNSRSYGQLKTVHHGHRGKHFQVEGKVTATGAAADEVFAARPGSETALALALLKALAEKSHSLSSDDKAKVAALTVNASLEHAAAVTGLSQKSIEMLVHELEHAKSALVLPAESLALGVHAAEHHVAVLLLNKVLGGIGRHFNYSAAKPITQVVNHRDIFDLLGEMKAGKVDVLILKDANPAYALAPALDFKGALDKVAFTVAFADQMNETVAMADLVIPVSHDLESWGEINTYQGIDMLQQPVMVPRWDVNQAEDHLIRLLREFGETEPAQELFRDYLKARWIERFGANALDKEGFWRESLKLGGRFNMPEKGEDLALVGNLADGYFNEVDEAPSTGLMLVLEESARYGDGTTANRGWMQELPDTMTGVTWDSFLEISYPKAKSLGLSYGDVVDVKTDHFTAQLPVALSETIADDLVCLATGMGHTHFSKVYNRGVNAFAFLSGSLTTGHSFSGGAIKVELRKTGRREKLATFHVPGMGDKMNTPQTKLFTKQPLHDTDPVHERNIYQTISLAAMNGHGEAHGGGHGGGHGEVIDLDSKFPMNPDREFYPDRKKDPLVVGRPETFYHEYKWEMAVDLNKCTGCGSCVTACYAENNLPVVGKDQVAKGREMSWIRINRYLGYQEKDGKVKTSVNLMPMMCQHCGNAPCESVCPSLATYHNREGLNAMIYNRCVGTRYCSNNCSYKVRRFNWFTWEWPGDETWMLNPAVSVRQKGVMEKCTFCVQRIRDAKDTARDHGLKVADGGVKTACQQACPSQAIEFGNYMDENSKVYQLAHEKHAYRALDSHINTKPGVSYLKRVVLDEEHG